MRNDFTSAAAAIAAECSAKRWDQSVTVADTRGWVSADAIHDWIELEVGQRSPQSILAELVSRLTDAEAVSLLHAIGHDKDATHDPLDEAMFGLVTERMVSAAEERINDVAEERQSIRDHYDAIAADRRAHAAEVNALIRAERMRV